MGIFKVVTVTTDSAPPWFLRLSVISWNFLGGSVYYTDVSKTNKYHAQKHNKFVNAKLTGITKLHSFIIY